MMSMVHKRKFHGSRSDTADLTGAYQRLLHDIALAMNHSSRGAVDGLVQVVMMAAGSLNDLAEMTNNTLSLLSNRKVSATEQVRRFQDERGITCDPQHPELSSTVLVLILCLLLEGGLGAALFFAGGKGDLFLSAAYGFSIAGINIFGGVINGFVFGRALGYKLDASEPKSWDLFIRLGAWAGFVTMVTAMLFMGFAAARVRATGSPVDIFDFDQVGLLATFADYYGILLIVLGVLGGIVAIREGWVGFSDPIVGYSRIWKQADAELRHSALDVYEHGLDAAEELYEDICDRCDDILDELKDATDGRKSNVASLTSRIAGHNLSVEDARAKARDDHDRDRTRQECIKGKRLKPSEFDGSRWNALLIDLPEFSEPKDEQEMLAALTEARQALEVAFHQSTATIEQAYTTYLAGVSGFDPLIDEEGDPS